MWTLTIRDINGYWRGRGPVVQIHDSEDAAEDALTAYVERNWQDEMPEETGPYYLAEDAVQEYFDTVNETYTIAEVWNAR